MDLYRPDKFPVIVGNAKSRAALCTVWNDPYKAVEKAPELLERFAIIGSLYTRSGIPPLIRNLALHPEIAYLVIWDHGERSRTDIGRSGIEVLAKMLEKGIADDGLVADSTYRLEKEIDTECVREIARDTALSFASDATEPWEVTRFANPPSLVLPIRRGPRRFAPAPPPKVECWPAESAGWLVRGRTIVEAWLQVVRNIMRYGVIKGTQVGLQQKECVGFTWVAEDEDPSDFRLPSEWPAELAAVTGSSPEKIAGYLPTILKASDDQAMYGTRLRAYPLADGCVLDQVTDVLVRNFRESPDSRRAVATTMIPSRDWNSKNPPCLISVECLQSEGKLHMLASLRSHDIYKGGLPNTVGLRHLQKVVSDELGYSFRLGQLLIQSASAHIYENDWGEANKMVSCAFDREPTAEFVPDPRGNFVISVNGGIIRAALFTPEGTEIGSIEGTTPRAVMAKIAQQGLITDPGHLMYLGSELTIAHMHANTGNEYKQS